MYQVPEATPITRSRPSTRRSAIVTRRLLPIAVFGPGLDVRGACADGELAAVRRAHVHADGVPARGRRAGRRHGADRVAASDVLRNPPEDRRYLRLREREERPAPRRVRPLA